MVEEKALEKLGHGCFSLTFLLHLKNKEYVVKCPLHKGHLAYKRWLSHIQKEKFFLAEYALHQHKISVPKILEVTDHYIVQRKIEGAPLTEELYEHLSLSEQKNIVNELAYFFFKLHQKTTQDVPIKAKTKISFRNVQKFFDKDEMRLYKKHYSTLRKKAIPCVFPCLCISDLKSSHILYDLKTKKIGLLDFGSIHFAFPEDEFILKNPIRSHLSLKMLKDTISAYNTFQKKNTVLWERVKSHLILYALKEVYTLYLNKKILPQEKERLRKILYEFTKKLEQL